jgi:hypothetical protein
VPRNIKAPPPSKPAYFWWLLANLLALCFALVSWFVCLYIFQNPEVPQNYEILRKLKRVPELKRYVVLDVPNGTARGPQELYKRFFGGSPEERVRVNGLLMRNYLTNFEKPLLLTYVEGRYQIDGVRPLTKEDFISEGVVIRAQALVKPDEFTAESPYPVVIEYVFPTIDEAAASKFKTGDILEVRKSPNCAAVVHVDKARKDDDDVLLLTVIPIAYGPYQIGKGSSFNIEPPLDLQPAAGFPMFK